MFRAKRGEYGTLFITIGAERVECGLVSRGGWIANSLLTYTIESDHGIADALVSVAGQLQSKLRQQPGTEAIETSITITEVHVLVADVWLSAAEMPWSVALRRADTTEAAARAQLNSAGFEVMPSDVIKLDDAPFGQPRLVVAYPATLLSALSVVARQFNAKLASILPLGAAAWSQVRQQLHDELTILAIMDEGLLLIVQGSGRLTNVTVRTGSGGEISVQTLREWWQRLRFRMPHLAQTDKLSVLNLMPSDMSSPDANKELMNVELPVQPGDKEVPRTLQLAALSSGRSVAIDAVGMSQPMTTARWAVAAAAFLLSAFLVVQAWQTTARVEVFADKMKAAPATKNIVQRPISWSREEVSRVQAVNEAIRELNLPISALMLALQPPSDIRVAVLGVDLAGTNTSKLDQSSAVKIVAEARSSVDMARYVGFLAVRKPFIRAYLLQHEIVESAPLRPYRFTVEATWSE
ncbi:MAG: hypothetical protein JWN23_2579 [Rhodocyclales bacterium]|nr:hypothetical protein [Rhodocyclales bacterium]